MNWYLAFALVCAVAIMCVVGRMAEIAEEILGGEDE